MNKEKNKNIEELKKFLQIKINNSYTGDSYQLGKITAYEIVLQEIEKIFKK